ncbi:MAG: 23S rRNA (adenine(2503)-C(2))-methyltransferase [Chloroflexi bacterium RBG_13_46_14]|nr:MAG: 23S rRNA (adenine(2503)-C(2))-methyltransferase [Chloroflexi bacterium RBG_13_46_14]
MITNNVLLGLNTSELHRLILEEGEFPYRSSQLAEWLYRHGARTFDDMSSLPAILLARLAQKYKIGRSKIAAMKQSRDGSIKLLLEMSDGTKIETVGLPYADRFSCCLSTQVGCPTGCIFCASGQDGLIRNLEPGEIVEQVLTVNEMVESGVIHVSSHKSRIDHVVFMGTGEPLLNYESTIKAVRLMNSEMRIGARNITVSTIGIVPGILKLAKEKLQITLAVSLHAPNDKLRKRLIPGMTRWSINEIMDASSDYIQQTGRRVTFEYCMLDKINDGVAEARELAKILRSMNCHLNLIRYNPVSNLPFRISARTREKIFREILNSAGIQVTQRLQRGVDIDAACGQLRQ